MRENTHLIASAPGRHFLVASTGGHLAQLVRWSTLLGSSPDSLWVTFESPQSESLLRGRRVMYVPYVAPRDARATFKAFRLMMAGVDWTREAFTAAITTGAAVGLAGLTAARLHRVPSCYIESVSRVNGPSLTGRIVSLNPKIATYCQYASWSSRRWQYCGSLFDSFRAVEKTPAIKPRLFVTLGTIRPYRFDALVNAILATGLVDETTVWQLGVTDRTGLPGVVHEQMSAVDFDRHAAAADVVITHAGVGTIMHLMEMGHYPVVVPRRAADKEHVDDHQLQIAGLIESRGLAAVVLPEELTAEVIRHASAHGVSGVGDRPISPGSGA